MITSQNNPVLLTMALRRSKIEEKVSTNPKVLDNGYQKSFSFLVRTWPPVNGEALFPWSLGIYQLCYLRIAPTGKMTLIGKLGLVLEEPKIKLNNPKWSSYCWVSPNVVTFLSCPSSYTMATMPIDLLETLAAMSIEASEPRQHCWLPGLDLYPCSWAVNHGAKEICLAIWTACYKASAWREILKLPAWQAGLPTLYLSNESQASMARDSCYKLNMCNSLKFICWDLNPQFESIFRRRLCKVVKFSWGHEGGASFIGLVSSWEEEKIGSYYAYLVRKQWEDSHLQDMEEDTHQESNIWYFDLGPPSLQNCKKYIPVV